MTSEHPRYLRPYKQAQKLHGADFRATLWTSRASQEIRFRVMAETYPLAGLRILDAGCAMGDLLAYLESREILPAHYVGLDALEDVLAKARTRPFRTPAEFHHGDLVTHPELLATGQPDVVILSGTLNTYEPEQFFRTLDAAYAAAGRCLLFNFLSTRHSERFAAADAIARRIDPVGVFEHGLRLTRHVVARHDYYDGHDCTMAWIKEERL